MHVSVIGGGPAGLMSADVLSAEGHAVTIYDQMPSLGRKFLMAGRGGLNLTHSEPLPEFLHRYGAATAQLAPAIDAFPPQALAEWSTALGQPTFVGSSGRVFPSGFKTSPLLRALLKRLAAQGVEVRLRHRWEGWRGDGSLLFATPEGQVAAPPTTATILALGGASWPRLGSDGGWARLFDPDLVAPFQPANCGFEARWSNVFRERFAGQPLKRVTLSHAGRVSSGDLMMTAGGVEGGALYALSAGLRDAIARDGAATLLIDLRPEMTNAALLMRLGRPQGKQTTSNFLRKWAGLSPVALSLLREVGGPAIGRDPYETARLVKALPLTLVAPFGLERAISSAGGLRFAALDERGMLRARPGVFAAGEMLDWEAPTGGYLLQAAFSTGRAAARHAMAWANAQTDPLTPARVA